MNTILTPFNNAMHTACPGIGRKTFKQLCIEAEAVVIFGRNLYVNVPKLQAYVDSISGGNNHGSVSTVQGNEDEEG